MSLICINLEIHKLGSLTISKLKRFIARAKTEISLIDLGSPYLNLKSLNGFGFLGLCTVIIYSHAHFHPPYLFVSPDFTFPTTPNHFWTTPNSQFLVNVFAVVFVLDHEKVRVVYR